MSCKQIHFTCLPGIIVLFQLLHTSRRHPNPVFQLIMDSLDSTYHASTKQEMDDLGHEKHILSLSTVKLAEELHVPK